MRIRQGLSASELSKGISTGDILSEDLVKSYIGRIKKFDKTIKAWAHFDAQYILDKAVSADDYRKLRHYEACKVKLESK